MYIRYGWIRDLGAGTKATSVTQRVPIFPSGDDLIILTHNEEHMLDQKNNAWQ
jgi:hypothetical protein